MFQSSRDIRQMFRRHRDHYHPVRRKKKNRIDNCSCSQYGLTDGAYAKRANKCK
jgi:hypothetical protein